MGPTAYSLYTEATGGQPVVEIGNPPTQDEIDAARKRVEDAKRKTNDAFDNWLNKSVQELDAWGEAVTGLPEPVLASFVNASGAYWKADAAFQKALDEWSRALGSASALPAADANLDAASVARANAVDALDKATQDVTDHMTPKNRAKWKAAKAATDSAMLDRILADEELRDAREALDNLHLPIPILLKDAF